ncbi:MAG: pyrroline-5-carboxylate reductase [Minisyncoccia bacterium]
MENQKIGVLGCGIMGSILLEVLSNIDKIDIFAFDNNLEKIKEVKKKFKKVKISSDVSSLNICDVVILAIKPQDFKNLNLNLSKNTLVISIMAGVPVKVIEKKLGVKKIVRAMPNMAARIKKGMVGWTATKSVSKIEKEFTKKIFSGMGQDIYVNGDDAIDKITALSGSGPAYIFYMVACFLDSAISLGIKKEDARKIILSTAKGSIDMIGENTDLSLLVKNVASKGGTTEAALEIFKKYDTKSVWEKAIKNAYKRAKELSKKV